MDELAWVPDACTLPSADQPARLADFDELFASLRGLRREDPRWLRLRLGEQAEERARELTARESECCSFFEFDVHREAGEVIVDIRVPASQVPVLDALEARGR